MQIRCNTCMAIWEPDMPETEDNRPKQCKHERSDHDDCAYSNVSNAREVIDDKLLR